jgi:hypothetical protein
MSAGIEAAEVAKVVANQNWFKTMTFGQALLLIVLGLISCATYFVGKYTVEKVPLTPGPN